MISSFKRTGQKTPLSFVPQPQLIIAGVWIKEFDIFIMSPEYEHTGFSVDNSNASKA
jgi:hypothetical protein